jgi:D-cysteine desulfhydrase family pyridoxal phosphate-dependent enzyme
MKESIEVFRSIEKIDLAPLSTPIDKCKSIQKHFENFPELYIKRDDFIGPLVWGNKLRKIEYCFAEAMKLDAKTVITCGGIQSNHARITAQAAKRIGLNVILVLNGEPPDIPTANYLVNKTMGIELHFVASGEERSIKMQEIAEDYDRKGELLYEIPLGASNDIGALGFVNAFSEFIDQEKDMGIEFDYLIHSSSSGGTQTGLEVGKRLFERDIEIIGVSSDSSREEIRDYVLKCGKPIIDRLQMGIDLYPDDILVDIDYIGPGYSEPSKQSLEAADLFARYEGILLDQTYTAKAAAAIIDYVRKGRFTKKDKVLFWLTGGTVTLFA